MCSFGARDERVSEKKGGERRSGGAEGRRGGGAEGRSSGAAEEKGRRLIIFGYKAQEIPPKISFTRDEQLVFLSLQYGDGYSS